MVEVEGGARLSAAEYRRLRDSVCWKTPHDDAELQVSLDLTWNAIAREDGEAVGVGRLLDDGLLYATIWDMIVVPRAQRRGIGSALLELLLERSRERHIVALVASPVGRPLYEKYGFAIESRGAVPMLVRPREASA